MARAKTTAFGSTPGTRNALFSSDLDDLARGDATLEAAIQSARRRAVLGQTFGAPNGPGAVDRRIVSGAISGAATLLGGPIGGLLSLGQGSCGPARGPASRSSRPGSSSAASRWPAAASAPRTAWHSRREHVC